jgi:uncharacterized protein YbcI
VNAGEVSGEELASVSNELVRLLAQHYGKGPTQAKSYICDDWLFCVMKDGITATEQTLLEHGEHDLVRQVRLRFQGLMADAFMGVVEQATGRRVLTYHSQVVFDPDFAIEMFLLASPEQQ